MGMTCETETSIIAALKRCVHGYRNMVEMGIVRDLAYRQAIEDICRDADPVIFAAEKEQLAEVFERPRTGQYLVLYARRPCGCLAAAHAVTEESRMPLVIQELRSWLGRGFEVGATTHTLIYIGGDCPVCRQPAPGAAATDAASTPKSSETETGGIIP
jgi:hypothetical protein